MLWERGIEDRIERMFDDLLAALTRIDRDVSDAERIDQLTALERVKATCAAIQARTTVDFAEVARAGGGGLA